MKVTFAKNTFSNVDWQDLETRLQMGVVKFSYIKAEDGSLRYAVGTRDLNNSHVDWDLLPMNIKTPPPHVLTYIDLESEGSENSSHKDAWRCFIKNNLVWYSDEVDIDDD